MKCDQCGFEGKGSHEHLCSWRICARCGHEARTHAGGCVICHCEGMVETLVLSDDEQEAMVEAVATTLAQWLIEGRGRDAQFDALVRVGNKIGMVL